MIDNFVRKHLRSFSPYTSARSEVREAELFLDANELSLGSPVALDGIQLNRYPDPIQAELRGKLAAGIDQDPANIFVGAGSDEIIDLLIRLFCEPSDKVMVMDPTYGVYRVAATVNGNQVVEVALDNDFQLDIQKILASSGKGMKVVFLCSPNNPTGNLLKRQDILSVCRSSNAIVAVDQAYLEFADSSGDIADEVAHFPNLVVLRTLSKAWGLAGIRLGYCIAQPPIVSYLLQIKAPYNINAVTSKFALDALGKSEFLKMSKDNVKNERNRLQNSLKALSIVRHVYPSDANFLLVEFNNAREVYNRLAARGIIVRRRSEPRLANCLRITVGTSEENERVLQVLEESE